MLDPRIYRTGLIGVVFAVIVVAFSLGNQERGLGTTLPPVAFNGQNAYSTMTKLAQDYPDRRPGSSGDAALATYVTGTLRRDGFMISANTFEGRTALGKRALETVIGSRAGLSPGTIVVLTHRDALGSPAEADLSGTAVLLELARVLSGETQHHSLMLVSTTGSAGLAGASELARTVPGPIDAVIALGDLAGDSTTEPILVPWSSGRTVAPTMLRNTASDALHDQTSLRPGGTSLAAQIAHLAFPLAPTEQAPFGALGVPAVLLSLAGEHQPAANEPVSGPERITSLGDATLEMVTALDQGPEVSAPSSYLLLDGKVVPLWAVRLLVIALILPMTITMIDGLARARRRGHPVARWIAWVLAGAAPFLLALVIARLANLSDLIIAPPGAVTAGQVPLHGSGIVVLALCGATIISLLLTRRRLVGLALRSGTMGSPGNAGAAAAVLLVMVVLAFLLWSQDPFAAALVLPALNLWPWMLDSDLRVPRPIGLILLVIGLAPPALVALYYALSFSLGPVGVLWSGLLLFAGGAGGLPATIEWCVLLGCLASVVSILVRMPRAPQSQPTPVTARGPLGYAGPGSLGGTESALRR